MSTDKQVIYVMPTAATQDPFDDVTSVEQVNFHDGTAIDQVAKNVDACEPTRAVDGVPVAGSEQQATIAAIAVPTGEQPVNPLWSTGLCDCLLDVRSCFENCVCTQCQVSRQYSTLHYGEAKVHWLTCLGVTAVDALFMYLTYGTLWVGSMALNCHNRGYMRTRYGIESGSKFHDAMSVLFCNMCVTCQHYREMSVRGEWPAACCIDEPFALRPPLVVTMGQPEQQQQ